MKFTNFILILSKFTTLRLNAETIHACMATAGFSFVLDLN